MKGRGKNAFRKVTLIMDFSKERFLLVCLEGKKIVLASLLTKFKFTVRNLTVNIFHVTRKSLLCLEDWGVSGDVCDRTESTFRFWEL